MSTHRIISLFNHKGGVSKTTTCFGLGWMLAEMGKSVIMVDADPQANLTGLVLGEKLEEFLESNPENNLRSALAPAYESQPNPIVAEQGLEVPGRPGLFLIPGHIGLSEYEVTLGIAQTLSSSIHTLRNLPGAFRYWANLIAAKYRADYILVDLNPSLGALNQNIVTSSDAFIVPAAPDYFSAMAIRSLTHVLPRWAKWAEDASSTKTLQDANYPFINPGLKFIGTIIQNYRPRLGGPTVGFQKWVDELNNLVSNDFAASLSASKLLLEPEAYAKALGNPQHNYCLAQIPNFNTLAATSQQHSTPVFAITREMTGHVGTVLDQDMAKVREFHGIFSKLAGSVLTLASK